jgi:hypothetical protein
MGTTSALLVRVGMAEGLTEKALKNAKFETDWAPLSQEAYEVRYRKDVVDLLFSSDQYKFFKIYQAMLGDVWAVRVAEEYHLPYPRAFAPKGSSRSKIKQEDEIIEISSDEE